MLGSGTQADPYIVETWEDFITVLPQSGIYATFGNDIDMRGEPINDEQVFISCNLNGAGYAIKNVYLSKPGLTASILFKLDGGGVISNLNFENWYTSDVWIFNGTNAHPNYYPQAQLKNCTFTIECAGIGKFIYGEWQQVAPIFDTCSVFLLCKDGANACYADGARIFRWVNCNLAIYGDVGNTVITGYLDNTYISGEVNFTPIQDIAGIYINNNNDANQAYINMTVHSDTAWTISGYANNKVIINTDNLENCTVDSNAGFITGTTAQINDATWLATQNFDIGRASAGFDWHNFLSSIQYLDDIYGNIYNVDTTNDKLTFSVTNLENWAMSQPCQTWQYGTYTMPFIGGKKYTVAITATMPTGVRTLASFIVDNTWVADVAGASGVFSSPYDGTLTMRLGIQNRSGTPVSGTFTIDNMTMEFVSAWDIVNGKLINTMMPALYPLGAFCYAYSLAAVSIPSTVKKIGRYSFTYTNLTSVELADDCTYYSTSFPEGCIVTGGILLQ